VLPRIIEFTQSAFLNDKGLLDSVLVANEVVHGCIWKKESMALVKMGHLGLCSDWIKQVRACMESFFISVLVNGPTKKIKPTCGFRQGDPVTPFLFIIVEKELTRMVRQMCKRHLFKGISVRSEKLEVSILQFADDTLFMCEANSHNILVIKYILRWSQDLMKP